MGSKKLLKNAMVISRYNTEPFHASVFVEGNRIASVIPKDAGEVEDFSAEEVVDLTGKLLIPGAINAHTHAAMTVHRGLSDDDSFEVWLNQRILPLEERLDWECVYWASLLAMCEMVKHGTTSFVDMYFFEDAVARAASEMGMRAWLSRGLVDLVGDPEPRLEENIKVYEKWHGSANGRIQIGFGPHAPYTCSKAFLARVAEIARELGTFVTIHLYEAAVERERFDICSIEETGILDNAILAHMVHPPDNAVEVLRRHDVLISHNPSSNLKLGNGIAPVQLFLRSGLRVGLGTDGAASNNRLDVWKEAHVAALIHKRENASAITTDDILKMIWEDPGAFFDSLGRIEPGYLADLVVVDADDTVFKPRDRLRSHLVYAAFPGTVTDVMINGEWVYRDGEFVHIDCRKVGIEFEKALERIW
ncbi:MAG: amidohydrolase [Thermotogae bacterium]|nr:amidohydrolase [Thermotogota bacterium]